MASDILTDESRFCLQRNEGHRWVWWWPGKQYERTHFEQRQTHLTLSIRGAPDTVLQEDNTRPQITRQTVNSLTAFDIFSWPAKSLDLNPIKPQWDFIGRDMNREPLG
ncbi:hypothetical protein TNCV_3815171 [Trichonephila clavipes]|nr:hypothetical protein TNCV_3815171 [Trichonephila clavipes]